MATPKGYKIDVSRSIRVGDNKSREAPTLGFAYREDAPTENEEVLATEYSNVLPTDRGYRSAFDLLPYHSGFNYPSTFRYVEGRNQSEAVKASPKQHVLWLETGSLERVGVLLGEDGIWFIAPRLGHLSHETTKLDSNAYVRDWGIIHSMPYETGVRYLWTYCVIDGVVYAYRQGNAELYIITDFAITLRNESAEVVWENEYLQFRVYKATPTFLNMEGQMGVFRADNRLGFWDSDNSIAWSSALDKLDFKPDVTTFAGITKYSEVAGVITKVVEHGKGFIIYASRSIVHCQALANSPEKWAGAAVIGNSGVQYDTQIAVGHPSTIHYVWVDNSMAIIENGSIQFSLPELSDMVKWQNSLVMLTAPCSRYLYISLGQHWTGADFNRRARVLLDPNGEPFWKVPGYTIPGNSSYTPDSSFWGELISGGLIDWTEPEWIERDPSHPNYLPALRDKKPLIPFFSGHTYKRPINSLPMLQWQSPQGGIPTTHPMSNVDSFKWPGLYVYRPETVKVLVNPSDPGSGVEDAENQVSEYIYLGEFRPYMPKDDWDMTSITQIGTRYLDKAGADFIQVVHEAHQDFLDDVAYIRERFEDPVALKEARATLFDYEAVHPQSWLPSKGWYIEPYEIEEHGACTIVKPIDVTESQSFMNPAWLDKLTSKDETQLEGLSEDFLDLATLIRSAVARRDIQGLRAIAAIHKNIEPEITKAIRRDDLESLEAVAKRYENDSQTIKINLEQGTINHIEDIIPKGNDWDRALEEAIYSGTEIPGVQIINLGVCSGVLPLGEQVQTVWDGCEMRMLAQMDKLVAVCIRYLDQEAVYIDSKHCLLPPYNPDPDNPTYSYFLDPDVGDFPPMGGVVYMNFEWRFMPESLFGLTYEEREALKEDPESDLWVPIFDAELSGWGYEWRVGSSTSYRRTHNVSPFTPCEIKDQNKLWGFPPPPVPPGDWLTLDYPQDGTAPVPNIKQNDWQWEGLPGIVVPDQEFPYPSIDIGGANFQKGTKHPYYPTYEWALIYDSLLKKWGSLDIGHQLVFSAYPVNSNTQLQTTLSSVALSAGIIPVFHTPDRFNWDRAYAWGLLRERQYSRWDSRVLTNHLLPVGLSPYGCNGSITYSKIGAQRAGHTKFTGISVKLLGKAASNYVSVELGASLSNMGYIGAPRDQIPYGQEMPRLSQLHRWTMGEYGMPTDLEAPANVVGRWASVIIRGNFDLTGLTVYGKPVGRLRYFHTEVAQE